MREMLLLIPQRYEFSSKSQRTSPAGANSQVVADTTKVRIFKQITTSSCGLLRPPMLLLIPQRYEFSSKSQPNALKPLGMSLLLLIPQRYEFSSKSQLDSDQLLQTARLLLIPQRYEFSSKSQHNAGYGKIEVGCC